MQIHALEKKAGQSVACNNRRYASWEEQTRTPKEKMDGQHHGLDGEKFRRTAPPGIE